MITGIIRDAYINARIYRPTRVRVRARTRMRGMLTRLVPCVHARSFARARARAHTRAQRQLYSLVRVIAS